MLEATKKILGDLKKYLAAEDALHSDSWVKLVQQLEMADQVVAADLAANAPARKVARKSSETYLDEWYGGKDESDKFTSEKFNVVASEFKREIAIDNQAPLFSYDRHLVEFLKNSAFFAEISRWIGKKADERIPTAAMAWDPRTDDFQLIYNPRWFVGLQVDSGTETGRDERGKKEIEGVTRHEFFHLILKHVTSRRREPHFAWNLATDAAINCMLYADGGILPKGCVMPGQKWFVPRRGLTPAEQKMRDGLDELFLSLPKDQGSDWYFEKLMQWSRDSGNEFGDKGMKKPKEDQEDDDDAEYVFEPGNNDSHDDWDGVPQEQKDIIEGKLRRIVKRGVQQADKTQGGWGNMPSDMKEMIRASVDDTVDWESILRNYVGMFSRGRRATSIKKINKRYPYIHPGSKRGYLPHVAICMDQSGSVSDTAIEQFFGVLRNLAKKVTFTVVPFDSEVDVANIFEWKKGQTPQMKRTRSGGTNFQAVCDWVNENAGARKFDGMLLLTDGECSDPGPTRTKRGWIIQPGHKLLFKTTEMVIEMEEGKKIKATGALR